MAVVVNTLEDLTKALDEHPEWVDALRARLLPGEVSETPRRLDAFIAKVDAYLEANDRRIETIEEQTAAIKEETAAIKEETATIKEELKVYKEELKVYKEELKILKERNDAFEKRTEALERHMRNFERRFDRQEAASGFLKGTLLEERIIKRADQIAEDMGLTRTKTLTEADRSEMIRNNDTSGIAPGSLKSFRWMDLGMEAADQNGAPCYIAAEISYTVDDRDVNRAVRGAQLFTRFTGLPARAAVIGVRIDKRIEDRIEAGDVFYWQADEDILPR